jgi:NADH-quinone oxidoreductase subunit L
VFLSLVTAAFLTAFYTWRQISMTFLGKPRTESAAHAHESSWAMVLPLIILAFFALFLGYLGVHEDFPIIGPILDNPFHHIMGEYGKSLEIHAETLPFSIVPVLISFVVALSGLGLSWLVYTPQGKGWQTVDQVDPLEAGMQRVGLGWLYEAMRRKFYFDELYQATVVSFSKWLSQAAAWFDRTIVDGVVNLVGSIGAGISTLLAWFDATIVDGLVNATGAVAGWTGGLLRLIQNGRVQTYLLVALLTVFMLLALFTVAL